MKQQHELVIVLDFGAQYKQLIARRVREANVYCEVLPFDTPISEIKAKNPKGIIFTGGPSVVYEKDAPIVDAAIFDLGIPILGICYGAQLIGHLLAGKVAKAEHREYGRKKLSVTQKHQIFAGVESETNCWMSHTYYVSEPPKGFEVIAETDTCPIAAFASDKHQVYGVQFHPEVVHTPKGTQMLQNFLLNICGCKGDWIMSNFAKTTIAALREKIGDKKVLCGLSGGVDSSVAAMLIYQAVGKQLTCIFVDHGLLRKNEARQSRGGRPAVFFCLFPR